MDGDTSFSEQRQKLGAVANRLSKQKSLENKIAGCYGNKQAELAAYLEELDLGELSNIFFWILPETCSMFCLPINLVIFNDQDALCASLRTGKAEYAILALKELLEQHYPTIQILTHTEAQKKFEFMPSNLEDLGVTQASSSLKANTAI